VRASELEQRVRVDIDLMFPNKQARMADPDLGQEPPAHDVGQVSGRPAVEVQQIEHDIVGWDAGEGLYGGAGAETLLQLREIRCPSDPGTRPAQIPRSSDAQAALWRARRRHRFSWKRSIGE
jgi:hypothetical protein